MSKYLEKSSLWKKKYNLFIIYCTKFCSWYYEICIWTIYIFYYHKQNINHKPINFNDVIYKHYNDNFNAEINYLEMNQDNFQKSLKSLGKLYLSPLIALATIVFSIFIIRFWNPTSGLKSSLNPGSTCYIWYHTAVCNCWARSWCSVEFSSSNSGKNSTFVRVNRP